ncbi:hypothetical protein [Streptomyces sp. WAC01280]|uniref:hypothetical protein n=1 Tax=Streptomyces sp. WAC01280 TaxID=2487424 RepID=UPI000F7B5986|nr:hypothetical protein [Streptomyces sp. WAC01280]RSS57490.1 hypothetical protein EF909_16260 [Streptomyces sp. WAC01280]
MTATTPARVGRTYTRARGFPWVLGKIGDFVLWLGPYNAPQLIIAAAGVFLLIKTFSWWAGPLGPIPVAALGVAVWAARANRIAGRAPLWIAYGVLQRALQPSTGRIGGRTARVPRPRPLTGTFLIEHTSAPVPVRDSGSAATAPSTAPDSRPRSSARGGGPAPTPLQQMLRERPKAAVR